jgi:hypothetical protein
MNSPIKSMFVLLATTSFSLGCSSFLMAADPSGDNGTTVKGEVVDLVCYTDSGARGPDHADCAKVCINAGLPVGLRAEDGKVYMLVGEHKPLNSTLAQYAAKTVTMRGKLVSRDGDQHVGKCGDRKIGRPFCSEAVPRWAEPTRVHARGA